MITECYLLILSQNWLCDTRVVSFLFNALTVNCWKQSEGGLLLKQNCCSLKQRVFTYTIFFLLVWSTFIIFIMKRLFLDVPLILPPLTLNSMRTMYWIFHVSTFDKELIFLIFTSKIRGLGSLKYSLNVSILALSCL